MAETVGATEWPGFVIEPEPNGISLVQISASEFELRSTIRYLGDTGLGELPEEVEEHLRVVGPDTLAVTDLASVPPIFRWWQNNYGRHTPAALIHDRFIGDAEALALLGGLSEVDVDKYFRLMLNELGFGMIRRWLMWSAVAGRTRFKSGTPRAVALVVWLVIALFGVVWLYQERTTGGSGLLPLLLPFVASPLWGRQIIAGLVIAYIGVPTMLLPATLAAAGNLLTAAIEFITRTVKGFKTAAD